VDDEDFPMVSEVDLKLSLNRTFIKGADFNSDIFQITQVSSGNSRSDGVTHDGDSHPFFCLFLEEIKKHFSCVIYAEDIELENDVTFGLFDCSHHFRISFISIDQEIDFISSGKTSKALNSHQIREYLHLFRRIKIILIL